VLKNLGSKSVWVVHGSDGLDEITTTGPTTVAALENGAVRVFEIAPEEVGLARANADDLRGGDAAHNAEALRAVLQGGKGAYRDVATLNAAAALVVSGRAKSLVDGVHMARRALDTGAAEGRLERLIAVSNDT
jgi:anthranilate phosphoribosyltransferase